MKQLLGDFRPEDSSRASYAVLTAALERLASGEPDDYGPAFGEALVEYARLSEKDGDTALAHSLHRQASRVFDLLRNKDQRLYGPRYAKALVGRDRNDDQYALGEPYDWLRRVPGLTDEQDDDIS